MLSCRIVTFLLIWEHFQGLSASHICLNGHLRSGPPAPVTVMLHAVYDFILNRATLSLKCSFSMVYAHTMMHTTFWYWNSSTCISQLYLLVIAPPWTVTFLKKSNLRKSFRKWHMTSLTSHLSISQQKQWSGPIRVEGWVYQEGALRWPLTRPTSVTSGQLAMTFLPITPISAQVHFLSMHPQHIYSSPECLQVPLRRFSWHGGDDLLLALVSKAQGRYWDMLVPLSAFNANVIATE